MQDASPHLWTALETCQDLNDKTPRERPDKAL